jgi:hypothetical protein
MSSSGDGNLERKKPSQARTQPFSPRGRAGENQCRNPRGTARSISARTRPASHGRKQEKKKKYRKQSKNWDD